MSESPETPSPAPTTDATRRRFLGLSALVSALTSALVLVPGLGAFLAPLIKQGKETDGWVSLGKATRFGSERKAVPFTFARQDGWYRSLQSRQVVVWKDGDEWAALSTRCTHLGCAVQWKAEERKFHCPCHGAEFDQTGAIVLPPADRPLERLQVRENKQTGNLEVKES